MIDFFKPYFFYFFVFISCLGYLKFLHYILYKRIFTNEKNVKFNLNKLLGLIHFFLVHVVVFIYWLMWTGYYSIPLSIGATLFIYGTRTKDLYPWLISDEY